MTVRERRIASSLLVIWAALTGALTLLPGSYTPPLTLETFSCVGCSSRGVADIIVNWMLFLPGGALMAMLLGGRLSVFVAACLTVVIETLQIGIPGRDPALQDLISNTMGALTGVYLVRHGLGRRAQHVLAACAAVAWLSPAVLLIPMTSSSDLYGQWTPAFATLEKYRGRILTASVGEIPVRSRILPNKASVDAAITARRPIEVVLVAGPAPSGFAPIFQIVDARRLAIVTIGALGRDLILRGNNPSRRLKLDQPDVRWRDAMSGVLEGDTVALGIDRSRDSVCMSIDRRTACRLAPSLANGWGHLAHLEGAPRWLANSVSLAWCLALGFVLGASATHARAASIRGAGLALVGLVVSGVSPDVRPDVPHAVLLLTGSLLGILLRRPIKRLWRTVSGD